MLDIFLLPSLSCQPQPPSLLLNCNMLRLFVFFFICFVHRFVSWFVFSFLFFVQFKWSFDIAHIIVTRLKDLLAFLWILSLCWLNDCWSQLFSAAFFPFKFVAFITEFSLYPFHVFYSLLRSWGKLYTHTGCESSWVETKRVERAPDHVESWIIYQANTLLHQRHQISIHSSFAWDGTIIRYASFFFFWCHVH